jgi:hypothetical protein
MARSRRPSDKTSTPGHRLHVSAVEALEALHTKIVDIEAFAHAAGEAVTQLPHTTNPDLRRTFARIYTLVSKVAADVHTCVRQGDKLIAAMTRDMPGHTMRDDSPVRKGELLLPAEHPGR